MELNEQSIKQTAMWQEKNILLPKFNRDQVKEKTYKEPIWLHFGPGNIFRAFIARLQQQLLNAGEADRGIIAVAPNSRTIIDKVYAPFNNLSLLVTMYPDGTMQKEVIGSVTEALALVPDDPDWTRLVDIITSPTLQILSFTITEKGYSVKDAQGNLLPQVAADAKAGPNKPQSFIGKLTALLWQRFVASSVPVTLLSLDNCSHNGEILQTAVLTMAQAWVEHDLVSKSFLDYVTKKITYPWSMIDKITPRPATQVQNALQAEGLSDMQITTSARGGYYAPFVNAESTGYLVIEDKFCNGRPALEKAGVIFTDQKTVEKVERMKVSTCLNPLHTTLAVYGCLLGYTLIADEMQDKELSKLVNKIGEEAMQVVEDPKVLSPRAFLQECLTKRFPNKAIPDTPQRIACDTSKKVLPRFGGTIKAFGAKAADLKYIPLALAGWCRYLLAVNDEGKSMELSPDPLLPQLTEALKGIKLGDTTVDVHAHLESILSSERIFGSNLYTTALGTKVEAYFTEMLQGPGAVRRTLQKYLS
jgi:fructuronate reductase